MASRKDTEDFVGTCPCCEGEFKVAAAGGDHWKMVNHGYQRPGDGWIRGGCFGVDRQPFEHSPEGAIAYRDALKERRASSEAELKRLQTPGVVVRGKKPKLDEGGRPVRFIGITAYDYFDVHPGEKGYAEILRQDIAGCESAIRNLTVSIDRLQKRIAGWTRGQIVAIDIPATGRVREMREAWSEEAEKRAAEREQRRREREEKLQNRKVVVKVLALDVTSPAQRDESLSWEDRVAQFHIEDKAQKERLKALGAEMKAWFVANGVEGKIMVRDGFYEGFRRPDIQNNAYLHYDSINVYLPGGTGLTLVENLLELPTVRLVEESSKFTVVVFPDAGDVMAVLRGEEPAAEMDEEASAGAGEDPGEPEDEGQDEDEDQEPSP